MTDKKTAKKPQEEKPAQYNEVKKSYTQSEIDELVAKRVEEEKVADKARIESQQLNEYMSTPGCIITDKEFLMRLHQLNVNAQWLPLFSNEHKKMTTRQIWERIRFETLNQSLSRTKRYAVSERA